uniref:cytochrome c oxidase subunit II n=1 Tax=Dinobdella ferox TaxID=755736 RepID=UPI0023D81C74|nr:cytochrome c oxidase subunit II [Dinobdella ferox]WDA96086.1 cytochrome c oxidase subunit II [Dinobdella ferox]
MSLWGQMMMQDPMSPSMVNITYFHDHMLLVMLLVLTVIGYILLVLCFSNFTNRYILEAQEIETIWTITPAIILVLMAIPSIYILYLSDEVYDPLITIKCIGHQWYWSYQYGDFNDINFDSYMVPSEELKLGDYRLLDVDNRIVVPMNQEFRVIVTAMDVIHSWTIPSLGIKLDAIPGRLNQSSITISNPGLYYGQCSEICGANHSFMPICLESISMNDFINWLNKDK